MRSENRSDAGGRSVACAIFGGLGNQLFQWAAGEAARLHGAKLAFDAEDLHIGEYGPGRGLETLVEAACAVQGVELHVCGRDIGCYSGRLRDIIAQRGAEQSLSRWLAGFDARVACELPNTWNHDLAASNKMFQYLAAGLPVLASPTRGQSEVLRDISGFVTAEVWEPLAAMRAIQELKPLPRSAALKKRLREPVQGFHSEAKKIIARTAATVL